jgi:uncharacterized protein YciI
MVIIKNNVKNYYDMKDLHCTHQHPIMDKQYFFLKLNPVRPDFSQTMTNEERQIMMKHVNYWKDLMAEGKVIVFGPVLHPESVYGIGVIAVNNEDEIKEFIANDPATSINHYEYHKLMAVLPEHV